MEEITTLPKQSGFMFPKRVSQIMSFVRTAKCETEMMLSHNSLAEYKTDLNKDFN